MRTNMNHTIFKKKLDCARLAAVNMKRKLFRQKPTADFPARGWFFFSNNFVLDKFKVIHNFFFKSWQLAYFVFYSFVISRYISRCLVWIRDPKSTMQKTGWTKISSLLVTWIYYGDGLVWYVLVWSGKGFLPMDVITKPFPVYETIFRMVTKEHPNTHTTGWS